MLKFMWLNACQVPLTECGPFPGQYDSQPLAQEDSPCVALADNYCPRGQPGRPGAWMGLDCTAPLGHVAQSQSPGFPLWAQMPK